MGNRYYYNRDTCNVTQRKYEHTYGQGHLLDITWPIPCGKKH